MERKKEEAQRASSWQPRKFPGAGSEQELRASFKVLNEWASYLQKWENKVRAMCGIMEAKYDLTPGQFDSVVASVAKGKHSKQEIRDALAHGGGGPFAPASDVVGHPPGPPYTDETI
jgi:hypothetical protein